MDKLTDIDGIGPVAEKALDAIGVTTFAELAAFEPEELMEHIDEAGGLRGSPDYHHWVMAARARVAGDQNTEGAATIVASTVPATTGQAGPEAAKAEEAASQAETVTPAGDGLQGTHSTHTPESEDLGGAGNPASPTAVQLMQIEGMRVALEEELARFRDAVLDGSDPMEVRQQLAEQLSAAEMVSSFIAEAQRRYSQEIARLDAALGLDAPAEVDGVTITVTGPKAGRRRAGHQFNAEPQTITVTPEQLAAIEADPSLKVEVHHG